VTRVPPVQHAATEVGDRKGAARLLDVLDAFVELNGPVTLSDLAERLQLPKSTVHRLLAILKEAHYVEQTQDRDRYRLGVSAFRLGAVALRSHSLVQIAHPFLKALTDQTGETVHLATIDADKVLILDRVESDLQMIQAVSRVGARTPLHATGVGKALLAWLPEPELDAILGRLKLTPLTANTITDRAALKHELAEVRAMGYAVDRGESLEEVRCVATVIRDIRQRPVAALSITAPTNRLPPSRLPELAKLARAAAEHISLRFSAG
jgi:IclR family acetate operon transcriptional repressor